MLTLPNNPILPKMSKFTAPVDKLVHETTGYINAQIDDVKLRTIKGLSQGTSAVARLLLIFIVVGAVITTLSFAVVLWIGEMLHSYALAAFIMVGVLLLVLVVLFLLRKQIFKNSFVAMYTDVFYQKEKKPEGLKTQEGVDMAIWNAETHIKEQEGDISYAFNQCKEFYTLRHFLSEGIPAAISSLFGKKEKKDKSH
jgi:hypothetical protein